MMTRQQLYDRIRQTSKDEYVLSEMKRLGFWEADADAPSLTEEFIKKESDLRKELDGLLEKERRYTQREAMLKEMRKKRMEESRKKQAETKRRNEQKRQDKAEAWEVLQALNIIYLGEGVSKGLQNTTSSPLLLQKYGLPVLQSIQDVANEMGITLGALRFLAYQREVSEVTHYRFFHLNKKTGGTRLISAPMPRLKAAQYWILQQILDKITPHAAVNGFTKGKSILSNAKPHIGHDFVLNVDIKDFFPSVTYKRVKGLFQKMGYSEQIATTLGLICTAPDVEMLHLDGKNYYCQISERYLPQGAPTSPAITNALCYTLDRRIEGLAQKYNLTYTRYADDITLSGNKTAQASVGLIIGALKYILDDEGFVIHPDKIHLMKNGAQKSVTGIVVNDKAGIDRATLRKFRALLHQIEKEGTDGKAWGKPGADLGAAVMGYAQFVAQVKPEMGTKLVEKVKQIFPKSARPQKPKTEANAPILPENTAENRDSPKEEKPPKNKKWWDIF